MPATASIIIDVDDKGSIAAFQQLNAQAAGLGPSLAPVAPQMQKISESTKQSREAAALLSEEFGVRMPRALRNVLAENSILGPALKATFTGVAVAGFIELVKSAVDGLTGFSEQLKLIQQQSKDTFQSIGDANKILIGPRNLQQVTAEIMNATKGIEQLKQQLGLTGDVFGDALTRGLTKYNAANAVLLDQLDEAEKTLNGLYVEQAKLLDIQRRTEPIEVLKLQNAAREAGLEGIAKIIAAERDETRVVDAEERAIVTSTRVAEAERNKIHAEAAAARQKLERDITRQGQQAILDVEAGQLKGEIQIEAQRAAQLHAIETQELQDHVKMTLQREAVENQYYEKLRELRQKNAEDVKQAEENAALAMLPPWERSYAQISVDTQRRLREIQQELRDTQITAEDAARLSAAAWQENFAKTRDQLANDLQSLFDDITSGNIGQRFKKLFEQLVFQMVATWILGMNQMRSASQQTMTGGGGVLGAIFGGLFGIGGIGGASGGPGGTPPFIGNFTGGNGDFGGETSGGLGGLSTIGLGPSAGLGIGGAGSTLPSGAGPGGPLGGLLNTIFSHGAFGASGALLGTLGIGLLAKTFRGGGILNALGGAAGGALTGFAIGGPIGAAVGAIVGFFSGLFGHSTKKARLAIEAQTKAQAKSIEDAYDLYQMDWTSAHNQLEQLRQQGVDALKQAGVKDINRSRVGHVDQWVDKAEKEIDATQKERLIRGALVFGPAQFRRGGFVDAGLIGAPSDAWRSGAMAFGIGGEVPAILHSGEFVMRPEAVQQIGVAKLSRMNAGGSGGDTHIHVNLNAIDGKSTEEWLRAGGLKKIRNEIIRARAEGAW